MPEETPGSPLWWVARLSNELRERRRKLDRFDAYYRGDHPLAFASEKFRLAFGGMLGEFADNWCDLVVDAVEERLNVEGFRLGETTTGDRDAWRIWQANMLDADSQIAHTEALINGESYALVWRGEDDDTPSVSIEHPSQMIVAHEAGSRRRRVAALKTWRDDDGFDSATLYLPEAIYKYRSTSPLNSVFAPSSTASYGSWVPREVRSEAWPLANPLGVVPVVPIRNRPRLLSPPVSEIARVIPVQDAINKTVADMLIASEFASFRQRWATGLDIPIDPETQQPIEPFKAAVDRLWIAEDPNTTFGEFSETSLRNFVDAIELLVQHVASQTRTPPHYFYLRGQFPSGESIKSAETGLVSKVERKQRHFGEAWEEVIRLAFAVIGDDERASITDSMTIWGDPESRTEGEHVDAVMKKKALGVPWQQLMEDLNYSPQQIARFRQMTLDDAAQSATAAIAGLFRPDEQQLNSLNGAVAGS